MSLPRRHIRRLICGALLAPFLWPSFPVRLVQADDATLLADGHAVIIEEAAWAGSSVSTADEWIELANLGDATATIAGWALRGAGESGRPIFLPPDATIAPRSVYLVANYADTNVKSALAVSVSLATTTVSLSNSALGIELVDVNGATIDRAGNGLAPPAGTSSPKATMIRTAAILDGTLAASWVSATTSQGFDAGAADFGTPGFCDLCAASAPVSQDTASTIVETIAPAPSDPLSAGDPATTTEILSSATTTEVWIETVTTTDAALAATTTMTIAGETATTTTGTAPAATTTLTIVNEVTTTTVDIIPNETASSAATVITDTSAATSSDLLPEAATSTAVSTTTAEITVTAVSSSTTPATIVASETPSPPPSPTPYSPLPTPLLPYFPAPLSVFLNEAMSNPASGPEWVELAFADKNATATDRALELWDAVSRIANIAKVTPLTAPGFLVVTLASARLNNSGDRLELRESSQTVLDATVIPELEDGVAWARRPSDGTWTATPVATPGAKNNVPAPVIAPAPSAASATPPPAASLVSTPSSVSTATTTVSKSKVIKKTVPKIETAPTPSSSTETKKLKTLVEIVATSTPPVLKTKPPKQTPKASPAIIPYPFSAMFENDFNGARVRVTGTVGSVPRLLGATHAFVLLGEDGRGVIVYLPKHLNVPQLGATVRVSGALTSTYRGPELRMQKSDVWMTVKQTAVAPKTRAVDLLMPGAEDAWSLVAATGTIKDVKARSFVLDVDGIDAQINIPPAVKYRPQRLVKGDLVRVTALLDLRRDAPALLPRMADEIEIVRHAPSSITAASADRAARFPDWTPFGAAAGAVVLSGAAQRLRELLRRRRLESLAAKTNVTA